MNCYLPNLLTLHYLAHAFPAASTTCNAINLIGAFNVHDIHKTSLRVSLFVWHY